MTSRGHKNNNKNNLDPFTVILAQTARLHGDALGEKFRMTIEADTERQYDLSLVLS